MTIFRRARLLDGLWLLALTVFVFAGMPTASFHGDEAMQIYMSHDYVTAFVNREPGQLMVAPPYGIDEDNWLRILNGSINRHAIGLSWHLAGFTENDLPPRPGWDWGLSYDRNVETGHRPVPALLNASRFSSTLFLALSAWVMFALGWQFGGRLPAYFISGLYTLNPVLLLNGRRAMMEGSLLFFGLLAVLAAVVISKRQFIPHPNPSPSSPGGEAAHERGEKNWRDMALWLLLALAGGLTLASKHSGVVFVAGAWGWILTAGIWASVRTRYIVSVPAVGDNGRPHWAAPTPHQINLVGLLVKLAISGLLAVGLFIALSPALWNDVPARFQDLIEQRQGLLQMQVAAYSPEPTSIQERLTGVIMQPFMTAPLHYEAPSSSESETIWTEIAAYMASPLSGLQFGVVLGLPLTLLAGIGLLALVVPRLRPGESWMVGLFAWMGFTVASLLVNPLPWQRYYLPWLPVMIVLAGVGLVALARLVVRKREQSPLAVSPNVVQTKNES